MSVFSETSGQLQVSIQNMLRAIGEITHAAGEGAEGSTNIAEKTTSMVAQANEVVAHSDTTRKCSEKLVEKISRFKV